MFPARSERRSPRVFDPHEVIIIDIIEAHDSSRAFAKLHGDTPRFSSLKILLVLILMIYHENKTKAINHLDLANEEVFDDLPGSPHGSTIESHVVQGGGKCISVAKWQHQRDPTCQGNARVSRLKKRDHRNAFLPRAYSRAQHPSCILYCLATPRFMRLTSPGP